MEVSGEPHAPATVPTPEEARNPMKWVPELFWTFYQEKTYLAPGELEPRIVQPLSLSLRILGYCSSDMCCRLVWYKGSYHTTLTLIFQCRLDSTALCSVPVPVSSPNRHVTLVCFVTLSVSFCYPVADFGLGTLEIFWKINLIDAVGIHKNNLDSNGLKNKYFCPWNAVTKISLE
jgi:hypothetical protein